MHHQLVLLQEGEDGINVVLHLAGTLVGNSICLLQLPKDQPEDAGCSEHEHDAKALQRENGDRLIKERPKSGRRMSLAEEHNSLRSSLDYEEGRHFWRRKIVDRSSSLPGVPSIVMAGF